jgi:hypothetical protein
LPIQPRHQLSQRLLLQTPLPELLPLLRPPPLGPVTAQVKGEPLMALVQPAPPPSHGTARPAAARRALSQRGPGQQVHQHPRLHAPQVPTSRRQRTRQRRAASATACLSPTQETRNGNRIEFPGVSIGLALIAAMRPQPSQTTPRTARGSIPLRVLQQRLQMVFKAGDRRHNVRHRRVFLVVADVVR